MALCRETREHGLLQTHLMKLDAHFGHRSKAQSVLLDAEGEAVAKDLGEYTEYEDGTVDQPFLNSDTLPEDEKDK